MSHSQYCSNQYESSEDDDFLFRDNLEFGFEASGSHLYREPVDEIEMDVDDFMDEPDYTNESEPDLNNFEEHDFLEDENDFFNFKSELGREFLDRYDSSPSDYEVTKQTVASLLTHCKSKFQVASSTCNSLMTLAFKFAAILHRRKRDAAQHLNLAISVSKSNHLQRKYNQTKLGVMEHSFNEGLFYYIPIEYTLKAIFGVPGVADLIDKDYHCKFKSESFFL